MPDIVILRMEARRMKSIFPTLFPLAARIKFKEKIMAHAVLPGTTSGSVHRAFPSTTKNQQQDLSIVYILGGSQPLKQKDMVIIELNQ